MKITKPGAVAALSLAVVGAAALLLSRAVTVEAVYPVERVGQTFSRRVLTRVVGFFRGAESRAENVRLRREVGSLSLLRQEVERLETENARLRRALDYKSRNPEVWLPAGVLSRDGGSAGARQSLRVDKGSLAGIRTGAVVVVPEGLVGRVTAVTPHTAEVTLVTDRKVKVACEIEVGEGVRPVGILSGGGDEALLIRHLRNAAGVPPRSMVLTSGQGGVFPPGLEIGTLLNVQTDVKGLACEGEVLPAVDYSTLEDVFIRREK